MFECCFVQIVGRKPNKDPGEVEAYAATMAKVGDALTAAAAGLLATPNAQVRRSSSSSSSVRSSRMSTAHAVSWLHLHAQQAAADASSCSGLWVCVGSCQALTPV
jgi:hypothetical protein